MKAESATMNCDPENNDEDETSKPSWHVLVTLMSDLVRVSKLTLIRSSSDVYNLTSRKGYFN